MNRAPHLSAANPALWVGVAPAQALNGFADFCSDPLTDRQTIGPRLSGHGSESAPLHHTFLDSLASEIIRGFTTRASDREQRFNATAMAFNPNRADQMGQNVAPPDLCPPRPLN
jgi:hypothetical protein